MLDPGLIAGDTLAEAPLLALEDLDVRLRLAQGLFQPEHIWRGMRGRRSLVLLGPALWLTGLGGGNLALKRGNLRFHRNNIRVFLVELSAELCQLLVQASQADLRSVGYGGRRPWRDRREGRGGEEGFRFGKLTQERLSPFGGSHLIVSVHMKLCVQPFEAREIGLHLLG